jgi:putative hydrolase of the HAD superfamily
MPKSRFNIVFDLDDTLYPEREFALSGFRACARYAATQWDVHAQLMTTEMTALLDSGHLGGLFKLTLEKHHPAATDGNLQSFIDAYRSHQPDLSLFEDAIIGLRYGASLGPIALITDGTDWVQRNKVQALDISSQFALIVYTGALGGRAFHKPHPRAFELVEEALGGTDTRLVYVGDNPAKDFVSPNARGWLSVQVKRTKAGIHDADAVADGGAPHHTISNLSELEDLIESNA